MLRFVYFILGSILGGERFLPHNSCTGWAYLGTPSLHVVATYYSTITFEEFYLLGYNAE
jgi:hypothetical protein